MDNYDAYFYDSIFSNLGTIDNSFVVNVGINISQKNYFYLPTMQNKDKKSKEIKITHLN